MTEHVIMTVGMRCPKPLFEVHKYIKGLATGDHVRVIADDPAFRLDIEAWCRRTKNPLRELHQDAGRLVAVVEKG